MSNIHPLFGEDKAILTVVVENEEGEVFDVELAVKYLNSNVLEMREKVLTFVKKDIPTAKRVKHMHIVGELYE